MPSKPDGRERGGARKWWMARNRRATAGLTTRGSGGCSRGSGAASRAESGSGSRSAVAGRATGRDAVGDIDRSSPPITSGHVTYVGRGVRLGPEHLDEPVDEGDLGRLHAAARLVRVEPCDPIDLREALPAPASRRPFHLELVGDRGGRVEVALDRPAVDDLAALLDDRVEWDRRRAVGLGRGCGMADLLGELAPGDGEEVEIGLVQLALRDRPMAFVPLGQERPTRMTEKDLEATIPAAEEKDARALPEDHRRIVAEAPLGARCDPAGTGRRSGGCDAPATSARAAPVEA